MDDTDRRTTEAQGAGSGGAVFLAALPFVLILLFQGLPMLLVESGLLTWEDSVMGALNTGLTLLVVAVLLGIFFLAWRGKWPLWSATWYPFFVIPPLLLAVWLAGLLTGGRGHEAINQDMIFYLGLPLVVAILLYAVTRLDPLRGLLTALPVIYLLWLTNMEFVADGIELVIKTASVALVFLTIAYIFRRGSWRAAFYAILAMNLVVGALFAYAGTYHGGTLPFTASGPNLVEVARSLIPQYLATGAILVGPLFARKFRQVGCSAGRGGKIAYHAALAALLLIILTNLASLMLTLPANSVSQARTVGNPLAPLLILGAGVYLVAVVWLSRCEPLPENAAAWAERFLLALLPLAIPLALLLTFITARWPVSNLYGVPLLWVLPHAVSLSVGLLWLGLSAWVITRGEDTHRPLSGAG